VGLLPARPLRTDCPEAGVRPTVKISSRFTTKDAQARSIHSCSAEIQIFYTLTAQVYSSAEDRRADALAG
jgi:hypothetical protein